MGYIYKITNKLNNKSYIGQTKREPKKRFWEHFYDKNRYNTHLHKAVSKYGVENFATEILEKCDNDLLNEREKYWIDFYGTFKNGYNETIGGGTSSYCFRKKVYQYDYDLNLIAIYDSVADAQRKMTGNVNGTISGCCLHKYNNAYGYIWCYENDTPNLKLGKNTKKPIIQYDLKGNKLNEFNSIKEAVTKLSLPTNSSQHIVACCKGNRKTYFKYQWRYKYNSKINKPFTELKKSRRKDSKIVVKYDKNGNEIERYNSIIECANKNNIKREIVANSVQKKGKLRHYDFYFRFL